ncbi:MAG: glycosyltransferase family 39 protein, partial [Vicinamibacteria bacterium]|nr:glycosyltransferase family 39 protein [Vicinamibacteria bacterium]
MILDRDDRRGLGLLMLSFLLGIACSWERWGSPLVDCGREMQAPLRILQGERLYADISYFYGPFSPYLHWGLYRLFGPSLDVLRIDGMISALLIIGLIYAIARQVMDSTAATMAAFGVTWLCAFKQAGNYILPYAYPAVHGCLFGLAAFLFIVRALQTGRRRWVSLAGLLTGLAFLSKLEMGCAALVGCWMALLLADRVPDRKRAFALA